MGVVTFPIKEAGTVPLAQLIDILSPETNDLCLLTGDRGYAYFIGDERVRLLELKHEMGHSKFSRISNYVQTQLRMAYWMMKCSKSVDEWIFFIGGDTLLIPMFTARILRKPVILTFAGSNIKTYESMGDKLSHQLYFLSLINCALCHKIVVYSPRLVEDYGLNTFRTKIMIAHRHFVDFDLFRQTTELDHRGMIIGYIGRLSEEKGVHLLAEAVAKISDPRLELLIIGDGQLHDSLESFIRTNGLEQRIHLLGWIPHERLGEQLNRLRLLVLPSYTEGLPNIVLEAMACGTPVLANRVGSIPDVITDGMTGYIMEDNSVQSICGNIQRALLDTGLKEVAERGMRLVEKEHTYESATKIWRKVLRTGE